MWLRIYEASPHQGLFEAQRGNDGILRHQNRRGGVPPGVLPGLFSYESFRTSRAPSSLAFPICTQNYYRQIPSPEPRNPP